MNWDTVKGDWTQFSGRVKEQWGKLTDDEITQINGNRDQLEGKLQVKYGYAKDKAKQEVDDWCNRTRWARLQAYNWARGRRLPAGNTVMFQAESSLIRSSLIN
jgi:uncharacterized protein YjbJ (UPF0337 family)